MGRGAEHDDVLRSLCDLAKARNTALITYKKPGENWITERNVEPYSLSMTGQDAFIVLTWQVAPSCEEPSWRNFRIDRITSVKNAGVIFHPRAPVTIDDGELRKFIFDEAPRGKGKSPPSPQEKYFKYVEKAMLDGQMTKREITHAKKLSAGLRAGQLRSVHASAYGNLIAEITMDGEISDDEEELLTNMRVFLNELGWAP